MIGVKSRLYTWRGEIELFKGVPLPVVVITVL